MKDEKLLRFLNAVNFNDSLTQYLKDYTVKEVLLEQKTNTMRLVLEKSYSKYYDTTSKDFSQKIDEEIVANTLGKQLGTQEYINRIVNNNPNIAQKIYRWVVDKLQTSNTIKDNNNNVTGFKSGRFYWEGVKNRF